MQKSERTNEPDSDKHMEEKTLHRAFPLVRVSKNESLKWPDSAIIVLIFMTSILRVWE